MISKLQRIRVSGAVGVVSLAIWRKGQLQIVLRQLVVAAGSSSSPSWNTLEVVVAVIAGIVAGSVSLVGFGIDSFIEVTSGAALLSRMSVDADSDRREATCLEDCWPVFRRVNWLYRLSINSRLDPPAGARAQNRSRLHISDCDAVALACQTKSGHCPTKRCHAPPNRPSSVLTFRPSS